jgi:hypothetical protein
MTSCYDSHLSSQLCGNARPYSKNNESKKDWEHGSSSRGPACQTPSFEFKPPKLLNKQKKTKNPKPTNKTKQRRIKQRVSENKLAGTNY